MAKPSGVVDTLVYDGLGREEMTSIEKALRSATPTEPVLPATFERLMRLALGRNLESGAPPPFPLVRTFEALGLGPLEPDLSGPAEILSALMAAIPERDDPKAIAEAHERIADSEFGEQLVRGGRRGRRRIDRGRFGEGRRRSIARDVFPAPPWLLGDARARFRRWRSRTAQSRAIRRGGVSRSSGATSRAARRSPEFRLCAGSRPRAPKPPSRSADPRRLTRGADHPRHHVVAHDEPVPQRADDVQGEQNDQDLPDHQLVQLAEDRQPEIGDETDEGRR